MTCSRSLSTALAQQMRLPESQRRWLAPLSTSTPPRTVPHTLFRSYHRWSSSSNHEDAPPPLPRDRRHWVVVQSQPQEQQTSSADQEENSSHSSSTGTSSSSGDSSRWSETLCRSDAPHRPTRKTVAMIDCQAKSSSATAAGHL